MADREQTDSGPSGAGPTWRPPEVVHDYRIDGISGHGGMGQVYRALDLKLHRTVALKFILGMEPDATAREQFMIEARAMARLQHPNVATIYAVDVFEGHPYLVMEYLSGTTLDGIEKPLHWLRVLKLGIELSRGLAAVHRHGVLHCDIKPDNVMLTTDGQVKLLDFGLAKLATRLSTPNVLVKPEPAPATIRSIDPPVVTDSGAIVGTPGYMAPESWRGCPTLHSDVYSFGVLLFEMCAGRTPYAEVAPHRLAFVVDQKDAPLLTEVVPTVERTFSDLVARCLSRDPRKRYSSEELHEALKGVDAGAWTTAAKTLVFREVGALVVSVHSPDAPPDADWQAYLRFCEEKMARGPIGVLVVSAGGGPTKEQRLPIRDLLNVGPVRAAVVTESSTALDISRFLGWSNPAIRTFSNATGLDDALAYLGVDGAMAERVRLEVRAMQHELA
jgi:serine/threonine protein kinase